MDHCHQGVARLIETLPFGRRHLATAEVLQPSLGLGPQASDKTAPLARPSGNPATDQWAYFANELDRISLLTLMIISQDWPSAIVSECSRSTGSHRPAEELLETVVIGPF